MAYVLAKDPGSRRIQIVTITKDCRSTPEAKPVADKTRATGRFAPIDLIVERCLNAPQMAAA